MLISIFHLLLHKHCQQLRISGRTEKGEREEERKMEDGELKKRQQQPWLKSSSCTEEEEEEFLGEDGEEEIRLIEQTPNL